MFDFYLPFNEIDFVTILKMIRFFFKFIIVCFENPIIILKIDLSLPTFDVVANSIQTQISHKYSIVFFAKPFQFQEILFLNITKCKIIQIFMFNIKKIIILSMHIYIYKYTCK